MAVSTDIIDRMRSIADEIGVTHARLVDTSTVKIGEPVRASCASNSCGRYGSNWGCPPAIGEIAELEARLRGYPEGLLIQNIAELEDSWDFEGMESAQIEHNDRVRALAARLREEFPGREFLALGAGGCHRCEKCTYPDAPCRFPELLMAPIEGYGVYVKPLVESVGLKYINGQDTVSYVGMVLFR